MYRVLTTLAIFVVISLCGCGSTQTKKELSAEDKRQLALLECQTNLKNIGAAIKKWSEDNKGEHPAELASLVPKYLDSLPACPVAGQPTYELTQESARYRITCVNEKHLAFFHLPK